MKLLYLFIFSFFIVSCAPKHRPYFFIKRNDKKEMIDLLSSVTVFVDEIQDQRNISNSSLATESKPLVKTDGVKHCMNVEKGYESDYWSELTFFASKYLGQFMRVKKVSSYIQKHEYKLTWSIVTYKIRQSYSEEANKNRRKTHYYNPYGVVGGVLGGLASEITKGNSSMAYKSIGDIDIVLEDVTLHDSNGNVVKSLGRQNIELKEKELVADADCLCAYYSMDFYFKQLMRELAPKIEAAVIADLE